MRALVIAFSLAVSPALADTPRVVADIAPVHSLVAQVAGEVFSPMLLVDRGGDPHALQLRPSQAAGLAEADLLIRVGPELTPWLDRALAGTGIAGEAVELLAVEGTRLRRFDDKRGDGAHEHDDAHGHEDAHDHAEADGHGHDHEGVDPHAWLDPANARVWLSAIAAHLAEVDPENAATYAANADKAVAAVDALDAELRAALEPVGDRPLFVFHDAYGYFADAYGLNVAGSIAEGDAASPGASRLADLRERIAATPGACVFAEANHDPAYVAAVSEGLGLSIGTLDPAGVTIQPGPGHYAETLRTLAREIVACAPRG